MIKYPNKIKKDLIEKPFKKLNEKKANLGVEFENKINASNHYYLTQQIASIYKKPTPIQVVKVDYPSRNKAKICEAYYKTPSTTDYNGIYKGFYIDFEAKSSLSSSFSFTHIYKHQIEHLMTVSNMGGIAFLLVEFSLHNETFVLPAQILYEKYLSSLEGNRKSISYKTFQEEGYLIKNSIEPPIDYLKIVDLLIEKKKI